jgi:D-arabinose 1-dehydrogenase-like Zn-dependent alcohol dehydrogenase
MNGLGFAAASNPFHLRNIVARIDQILGSTMGSTKDLADATAFIAHHKIVPEVSHVLRGLDEAKEGFELMASGSRLGKIVIKFPGRTPDGDVRT